MKGSIRTLALSGLVLTGLSACVSVPRGQGTGAAVVEQVNGKGLERDEATDQARNLRQQLVEIQNRRDLTAEIEERGDDIVLGWSCRDRVSRPVG